ncbi:hypothetical protein KOW79_017979 [Hemibagrus wyckioides]|uniref:Sperm acrosome-associated protein 9 n=2 Tax=Hemibagrus wyckioides TaxID=337641 RepID=A0A9D3NBA2_9TELE|nr:hypothetical protein KOW79_017979 [Hemibagrus wyckioides]
MKLVEEKHRRFKQQQFTFIAALERSREHARNRTQPVSTVSEVQWYMTHHCSNATDRRIFSVFLDIMDNLKELFQMIEPLASALNYSRDRLNTCRNVFSPECDFSQFQAQYPHDELNHLSCNEARNYYGGVVSVIPVSLDLLKETISDLEEASTETVPQTAPEQQTDPDESVNATENPPSSSKPGRKYSNGWKPAWKPA